MRNEIINLVKSDSQNQNYEKIKSLLESKANVNEKGQNGIAALTHAVKSPPILKLLLDFNAEVNTRDDNLVDPLFQAVNQQAEESIEILLEYKTDINFQKNYTHLSPLAKAASMGHKKIVQFLIEKKADINQQNLKYMSALAYAVKGGHHVICQTLLAAKADLNLVDSHANNIFEYEIPKNSEISHWLKAHQMQTLFLGTHKRLGEKSSLFKATQEKIWDKNVFRVISQFLA